jgi:hypothetical protein
MSTTQFRGKEPQSRLPAVAAIVAVASVLAVFWVAVALSLNRARDEEASNPGRKADRKDWFGERTHHEEILGDKQRAEKPRMEAFRPDMEAAQDPGPNPDRMQMEMMLRQQNQADFQRRINRELTDFRAVMIVSALGFSLNPAHLGQAAPICCLLLTAPR